MAKPISLMVELEALVAKAQAGDKQVRVPQSQTEMHEITILRGFWLSQLCGCGGMRGRIVRCVLAPPGGVRVGESAGRGPATLVQRFLSLQCLSCGCDEAVIVLSSTRVLERGTGDGRLHGN